METKKHAFAKFMYKELVNKENLKLISFSVGFSLIIGTSVYVSSLGLMVILNSFGIAISSKMVNLVTMYIGSQIIYKSTKSLVKESTFAEN